MSPPPVSETNLGDAAEAHSSNQVLSSENLHIDDFLCVVEKGVPKELVKVIGIDFLNEKIMVERIVGLTVLTAGLEFSRYSLNGHHGENWLETVSGDIKIKAYRLYRRIAKTFDPEKIDPDYFP